MRAIIQRVTRAKISINNNLKDTIGLGVVVLLGIEEADTDADVKYLVSKIINMRIFYDETMKKELSLKDVEGEILLVSQFTLHARVKKGTRPSYIDAAKPEIAKPLYDKFIFEAESCFGKKIATGIFGEYMQIDMVNDGPVTIIIDTKNLK